MISDVYFPRVNGVSTSIMTFKQHFEAQGHQITLIAPDYPTISNDENDKDDTIIRIASRQVILDPEDRLMKTSDIQKQVDQLSHIQFDILHIQTPFIAHYQGVKIAKRLNIPLVETCHTFFEEYFYNYIKFLPKSFLKSIARYFTRSQCKQMNALIVPSEPMKKVLEHYDVDARMQVLPTGIDLECIKPGNGAAFREKHNISPTRPVLVHISRVAFEKNIDFLIHVVDTVRRTIPDILFIIAGEGPAESSLHKLTEQLNLTDNILFLGYMDRNKELMDCYSAGDAFIFASRTETQGLVLLEAMALGLPVVSTAVMGTKSILSANKGALIAEDDQQDFSEKVIQLMQSEELQKRLSQEAIDYAKTWSAPVLADKMINFYRHEIDLHLAKN